MDLRAGRVRTSQTGDGCPDLADRCTDLGVTIPEGVQGSRTGSRPLVLGFRATGRIGLVAWDRNVLTGETGPESDVLSYIVREYRLYGTGIMGPEGMVGRCLKSCRTQLTVERVSALIETCETTRRPIFLKPE